MEPVTSVECKDIGLQPALNDNNSDQNKTVLVGTEPVTSVSKQTTGPLSVPKKRKNRPLLQKLLIKNQRQVNAENAMPAKKKATGALPVPAEKEPLEKKKKKNVENESKLTQKKKQKRAVLQPAPLNGPQNIITAVSTASNLDMGSLNVTTPSPTSNSELFGMSCSTNVAPITTPDNTDTGTGAEKPLNTIDDTNTNVPQKVGVVTPTPGIVIKRREPYDIQQIPATDSLAEAIVIPLGKRGMCTEPILPPLPFKADDWAIVVMVLGDLQEWKSNDTFQMLLGNVYWVPKAFINTEWLYSQILRLDLTM